MAFKGVADFCLIGITHHLKLFSFNTGANLKDLIFGYFVVDDWIYFVIILIVMWWNFAGQPNQDRVTLPRKSPRKQLRDEKMAEKVKKIFFVHL